MKRMALVTAMGAACFLAGRWSGVAAGTTHSIDGKHAGGGTAPELTTKRASRDRSAEGGDNGPKILISTNKVEQIVSKKIGHLSFHHMAKYIGEALQVLGTTEEETKAVLDVVARAKEEILAEEIRCAVIKEQTSSTVRFDLNGMKAAMEGVRSRFTEGIGQALPAESARILNGAIRWNRFYLEDEMDVTFTIERNKEQGTLRPTENFISYRDGIGIVRPPYKDDGTPIPADKVFGERWAGLLAGKTLLPIDAPEK